ncbi:MAG: hypothetical protein HC821_04360 [Lewinella sp.]|nr:hypothetical protein [Lewinella sp.]
MNKQGAEIYRANNPLVAGLTPESNTAPLASATVLRFGLNWRPTQKYRINNGAKQKISNSSPTFSLNYTGGFNGLSDFNTTNFQLLELGYRHRFPLGIRGHLNLFVRTGAFLVNEAVQLPDFKHFATTEIFYTDVDRSGAFDYCPFIPSAPTKSTLSFMVITSSANSSCLTFGNFNVWAFEKTSF